MSYSINNELFDNHKRETPWFPLVLSVTAFLNVAYKVVLTCYKTGKWKILSVNFKGIFLFSIYIL